MPRLPALLLAALSTTAGAQQYDYETSLANCDYEARGQRWQSISQGMNRRLRQQLTGLCLTMDSCETPTEVGHAAVCLGHQLAQCAARDELFCSPILRGSLSAH
jgi:hypothetical protein